jgi:hypothetical protein
MVSPDGREAMLEIKQMAVTDQPKWPAYDARAMPAMMTFRVVWKATDEKVAIDDKLKHFRFEGYRAMAQAEAAVEVPAINFSWKSDPLTMSNAAFAIIGSEVNGRYYDV